MDATEPPLKFLRSRSVRHLIDVASRTTVHTQERRGLLPPHVDAGGRALWIEGEITAVLRARAAGATDDDVRYLVAKLVAARPRLDEVTR